MTPPTAQGSISVMRRQPSHDVTQSPYYVTQPGQTNRNGLAAENGHKTKKSWGERLKLGGSNKTKDEERRVLQQQQQQQYQQQQAQEMANNNYLLHEYRSKYGTLSGGSALSKSMKYAETWLYGTVSVRPSPNGGNARPNVMLYHPPPIAVIPAPGDAPRHIIPHVAMCSCPEFVGGTMRSKKNTSSAGICKKCGGSRVLWRGAGTMRASTVRLPDNRIMGGTVRVGNSRVRPCLTNLSSPHLPPDTPDPYDLMRRNRLGASTEDDEGGTLRSRGRVRAKSTSPGRHNMRRSPSPAAFTLRKAVDAGRARRDRDMSWESDEVLDNHVDLSDKRKSILECDVNPYQLIAKYLKNGTEGEGQNNNSYHGNMNGNHEELDDDELSDDLSDNALENGDDVTKPRPAVTFNRRTEQNGRKATDVGGYKLQSVDKTKASSSSEGVTISGRRIRVFSGSSSAASAGEEFVEDEIDDEPETSVPEPPKPKTPLMSMIPRLASPKRPQRKLKTAEGETKTKTTPDEPHQTKDEEIESELLGESSPSNNNQIERRSNLVSSNIKSILKKPPVSSPKDTETTTSSLRLMREVKTFNDTIRKPDATVDVDQSAAQPRVISSSNFYLPTFQEYKQQNRKKKQVQFNVQASDNNNAPQVSLGEENVNSVPEITVTPSHLLDGGITAREGPVVSCDRPMKADDCGVGKVSVKVSDNKPVKLQYFGDHVDNVRLMAIKDKDNGGGMAPTNVARSHTHLNTDVDDDRNHSGTVVTLRRSLSDCQASSSDEGGSGLMFNDTMRLRLRAGRRVDSRQAFSHPGPSSDRSKRVVSPGRPRPKEPPPPPPLPSSPDTILPTPKPLETLPKENSFQKPSEFTTPLSQSVVPPPAPPPRQIFPFTKKQIQNINNQNRQLTLKTSPSTTLLRENTRKSRPNSVIPQLPIPTPETGSTNTASKIKHRNSDPGPTNISFRLVETPSINDEADRTSPRDEGTTCTIVTVCPESPDIHRLQIKTEGKTSPKHERRTSILLNGDNDRHDIKMAVTMDEIQKNNNKVTINVGGADAMTSWTNGTANNINNSCTIIDTSQSNSNSLTRISNCTNQVIIPVSPEPIYNHSSNVQVNNDKNHITIIDQNSESSAKIHHDYEVLEMLMDPVEAVKRHLVPHVCGKLNPDGGAALVSPSAMERLNSLLISQRQEYSETETSGSVVEVSSPELSLSDMKYSSVTTSECSDKTLYKEQENNGISVHYFTSPCIPRFVVGDDTTETDKQGDDDDDEEEDLHKDIYDDAENIYESIKDPIYEEIGLPDTPPPLPLSPPPSLDDLGDDKRTSRSIFEGASKYDILNYLVDAKERGYVESDYNSSTNGDEIVDGKETPQDMTSLGELSSRVSNLSNASDSSEDSCNIVITTSLDTNASNKMRKSAADIERNDSGVGSETSKSSRSRWQQIPAGCIREDQIHLCEDCDQHVETQVTDSGVMFAPLVCRKCAKKRAERKETIAEIVETEEKYGGDLQIILEEFYRPMLVAGLLTSEQLSAIFLNVEELLENNSSLAEKLRDALEIAIEQGDEDLLTVNIGSLFLEAAPMLHAFESYCTRQGGASILLANLEKEKELLRIFLRVSQMENAVLRRMNLNSFLMVPVQRVTKYPLLLARLYKVTPAHHQGRELLKQAQHKIELHLEHMNSVAKDISTTKLWRRISIINGRRSSSEIDMINIKLRKMAVDVLDWNHDEVKFAMEGRMLYTNPTDNNWRKGRTIKLQPINALLVTNGKTSEDYRPEDELLLFPRKSGVREATLLLVKEKCGRYALLREPLFLDKCIVCSETEWEDYFEVQELATKDTFIFKAEDSDRTKLWYHQLQFHSQGLGAWRRRRNALANIMINGMLTRN